MIRKFITAATFFLFVITATATAQLKVGYMNPQEVLNQLPESAQIEQKLNDLIEQKRKQLENRTANFQEAVAEYQQNAPSMSEEQKKAREEELSNMQQALQQFQQSLQSEIQQQRSKLLAPIFNRMDKAIAAIAEERNLDFVFNEATGTGENIVYFSSDQQMDITQEVLNRMQESN